MCIAPVKTGIRLFLLAAVVVVRTREDTAIVVGPCPVVVLLWRQDYAVRFEVIDKGGGEGHKACFWRDGTVFGVPVVERAIQYVLLGDGREGELGERFLGAHGGRSG